MGPVDFKGGNMMKRRIGRMAVLIAVAFGFLGGALMGSGQPASSAPTASMASQIKTLQKQLAGLTAQVKTLKQTKANANDLATVASGVLVATSSVQAVSDVTSSLHVALTAMQSSVAGVTKVLETKANASDLALKGDKTVLQALVSKVAALCSAQPAACADTSP
ncbi:MAG: hypothetical protein EBU85_04145 [Actinobacteria bacterium]|nr:hypothetical protein [Actinomycetota bacterium]